MNTWFKNNFNTRLKNCIALIAVLLLAVPARANHIVGLDLFYTWISGNTYKVTLVAYGDCGSATTSSAFGSLPSATPEICVFNGDTQIGFITLAIEAPSAGVEITPVCPTDLALTQCTDVSYAIPGIKKFVYSGTYTLPYASATWRFIFSGNLGAGTVAGRALSITNLSTANSITQLADTLNNLTVHNSNPNFTVIPTPFFCLSNANNYNPGAVDADGDSLAFFLVPGSGLTGPTSCDLAPGASYVWPATATAPLGATSFSFDNHTGQISFIPNVLQRSLVVYNIEEYRGGQKIGTCQREMTFIVLTCTDIAPTAGLIGASSGTIDDSIHYHVCQNSGPFSLQLQASEPVSTNNIWVTASGMPSGCTFSTMGNGTPHPLSTIAWTSTGVTPGTYTIYVTYTDDNCPLTGTRTLAYSLTIVASPSLTYTQLAAATCTGKAYVSLTPAGLGAPWHVAISDPAGDTIQTFSGVTGTIYDSLASGNYTVTLSPSSASFCTSATAISVAYPPGFNITTALTNPTYCGSNDGTITISGFTPGSSDSVRYHFNGVLQPAVYTTASAAGTITLTGLYAGTYSGIYAVYGNCVSNPIGSVILVNPPAIVPTATFQSPSYCGHHDGSITLHGLHPAYTDTIRFYFNGVAQPYQLHTAASDSTIVIGNLYAGTYTNITVAYSGCSSSPIGPIVLVNPSPASVTATFTNPSYCGHHDGTITLAGLYHGDVDTIKFYYNGVLQPPRPLLVSVAGTVVLTGLASGVYSGITATFGQCITVPVGPVTLTDPPLPPASFTFTNPSYCGHHDGTITISGLHAGDMDTVHFYYNGVLQPGLPYLVSASGAITVTGLAAGNYTNITTTFGPCITSPLGPALLQNPTVPVPAATFSSPTYCGSTDGYITISNLHPGDADTIIYHLNGVLQSPFPVTVDASGVAVLTGLGAGVYSNIHAVYGPCPTADMGPFTLINPGFSATGQSFTSPTKCGFCDGTMTFYGLHPGQLDSVHFKRNGIMQPAVVTTVLADSTITVSNLCDGLYTNIYVNFNSGCTSPVYGPENFLAPAIVPGFTYNLMKHCTGDTLVCVNTSAPASDLTYIWTFGDGDSSTLTNPTHIYTTPGSYHVVLHITNTKCVDSIAVNIVVDNLVKADFTLSPDSFLCEGKPVIFTNNSLGSNLTYTWFFGDGTTSNDSSVVHNYDSGGYFNIVLAVGNNVPCADTMRKPLQVDPASGISFAVSDSVLCVGGNVTFTGNYPAQGNTGVSWNFGDGNTVMNMNPVVHGYSTPGIMNITVEAYYRACPDTTATRQIWVYPQPLVDLGPDTAVCPGSAAIPLADHTNAANPAAHWLWSTGQTSSSIEVGTPGTYSVTVNINGCEATDEVNVLNDCYISIANVFTPDGDGANDYFMPRDMLAQGLVTFKMEIFNRWGNLIFSTTNTSGRGWDGKFNNVAQPQGVYVYVIDATFLDGQHEHHKGNVTLLR